jgi:hypothetical protein
MNTEVRFGSRPALPRLVAIMGWLACCCSIIPWIAPANATPPSPRNVLILYSWHDQLPWQAGVMAGVAERLQQVPAAERPEIFEQNLDSTRIKSTTDQRLSS